jgi:CheY-like chemotaxis protein
VTTISTPPIPGAGRHVTLVEDSQIQRKVLGDFLRGLGFEVVALASAAEALEHLVQRRPHAIVCDVVMPEIDGFALCRTIKDDPTLAAIPIVLLTSTDIDDSDQQLAARAGAEALVPRTPGFGPLVEALLGSLDGRGDGADGRESVMVELRTRFLCDGQAEAAHLARAFEAGEDAVLQRTVHRWAGRGSTLGFPAITGQARVLESALDRGDRSAARDALVAIGRLFREASAGGARAESRAEAVDRIVGIPAAVAEGLADRRVALVGFTPAEADRMAGALARVRARAEPVVWREGFSGSLRGYDLVVFAVHGDRERARWLSPAALADCEAAVLLVGGSETFLRAAPAFADHSILLAPWTPEALILRSFLALQDAPTDHGRRHPAQASREIVLADDDATILVLLEATLRNYGCRSHLARDGVEAIEITRRVRPAALILDINMPGRDGYEVLSTLRSDRRTRGVPIVLLTARHQEADIIRAFDLGASEYIVKPFNPLELVARLRRLVET